MTKVTSAATAGPTDHGTAPTAVSQLLWMAAHAAFGAWTDDPADVAVARQLGALLDALAAGNEPVAVERMAEINEALGRRVVYVASRHGAVVPAMTSTPPPVIHTHTEEAICEHCGSPIVRDEGSDTWWHTLDAAVPVRIHTCPGSTPDAITTATPGSRP